MAAAEQYGPLSQAELGRHTGIDRKDVTLAVTELEDRGLLARERDPADNRRNVVTLTASGHTELVRLDDMLADVQKAVLAPLSPTEQRTLIGLLRRLGDAVDPAATHDD
nr:MarR family winged helix-turn-helix transcriptional regulator [Jongsikchunia kroppenstedtii]